MTVLVAGVILVLVLVNALYVAAEFSAVSVRRSRVQQRAEDGNRLARRLLPTLEDPHRLDRYIAACQIGITLSSLVLGAYGQATLAPALVPLFAGLGGMQEVAAVSSSAVVVLVGLTGFQMILGELVPKSLALQFPTPIALWTVIPMQWSLTLLSWFIAVLNGSGIAVLRMFGSREVGHRHIHSPEEIEYLIGESREGGMLRADEHERLRQVLRLGVRRVGEVMVPRTGIQAVAVDVQFADAVRIATDSPYTRLPVYRGSIDEILGFVHVLDLARRAPDDAEAQLFDLMRPIAVVVGESMSAERVLGRLREERQHLALVVDEFGGTAGLVTIGDLLDDIFGGVADEFKVDTAVPQRLADGRVRLPGSLRLHETEAWVGVGWEGESHTVGGFIMERLGRIPAAGDRVQIDGVLVEVEHVRRHGVESVLAKPVMRRRTDADE